jgi:hypothetical protein
MRCRRGPRAVARDGRGRGSPGRGGVASPNYGGEWGGGAARAHFRDIPLPARRVPKSGTRGSGAPVPIPGLAGARPCGGFLTVPDSGTPAALPPRPALAAHRLLLNLCAAPLASVF